MKKVLSALAVVAALSSSVAMAGTPVMFSSINNFNAPDENAVSGVRVAALYGKVNEVKGLDLAVVGLSETDSTTGVNLGLLGASKVNQEMTGASLGLLNWNTGQTVGANVSLVNYSEGNTMVDVGAANFSDTSKVQVGLFNKTTKIEGVQVGLINCADNGFFKCFPIINFAK